VSAQIRYPKMFTCPRCALTFQMKEFMDHLKSCRVGCEPLPATPPTPSAEALAAFDLIVRHILHRDTSPLAIDRAFAPRIVALEAENKKLSLAWEVAVRDAGLYAATLAKSSIQLGCAEHMVDHAVKDALAKLQSANAEIARLREDGAMLDWLESLVVSIPINFRQGHPPKYIKLDRNSARAAMQEKGRTSDTQLLAAPKPGEGGSTAAGAAPPP
jgi:hypothetical protein